MPEPWMTCIHRDKGLCPECQADFEEDEAAWIEFGRHPEGIRRWEEELRALEEFFAAEGPPPPPDPSIPF